MKKQFTSFIVLILLLSSCQKDPVVNNVVDPRSQYIGTWDFHILHYRTWLEADTIKGHDSTIICQVISKWNVDYIFNSGNVVKGSNSNEIIINWGMNNAQLNNETTKINLDNLTSVPPTIIYFNKDSVKFIQGPSNENWTVTGYKK